MALSLAALTGERLTTMPDTSGWLALGYLALFGSMISISAYMYLIRNVSPAVATSYAYVNPVVAVLLGTTFAGKTFRRLNGWRWGSLFSPWCWSRWVNTCSRPNRLLSLVKWKNSYSAASVCWPLSFC
ncbi:Uncharacterized inner membrane transporter yedA [Cedecea neteri]|uniref:Uncharacterized inner membrane transporter yedA n=1 Tax=Cedecea neteri TaxID=158822 RepID=A0A2X3J6K8_9ENTR|nr:Uncharacterized inner membrane transporter yedA [Cedecea neteri]